MATVIRKDRDWAGTRAGAIGELLLRAGKLDEAAVASVLAAQRESGKLFGEVAIAMGLLHEKDVQRALARQFDYSTVEPDTSQLDRGLFAAFSRRRRAIFRHGTGLWHSVTAARFGPAL